MKKILILVLILSLLFSVGSSTTYASTLMNKSIKTNNNEVNYKNYESMLMKQGFPKERIKFLTEEEVIDIVNNGYKYIGSTDYYTLFSTQKVTNLINNEEQLIYSSTPITKDEFNSFKDNRHEFMEKNFYNLNKIKDRKGSIFYNQDYKELDKRTIAVLASEAYKTYPIDEGVLELSVNAYDASTSTKCIKGLGVDFAWYYPNTSYWALTDGIGLAHTAQDIGFTNYEAKGRYHTWTTRLDKSVWEKEDINPTWNAYGISAKFDIRCSHETYGRIYEKISNTKTAIPPNAYFSIVGGYAHQIISISGFSIEIGDGKVDFKPTIGSRLIEAEPQPWLNNIKTY